MKNLGVIKKSNSKKEVIINELIEIKQITRIQILADHYEKEINDMIKQLQKMEIYHDVDYKMIKIIDGFITDYINILKGINFNTHVVSIILSEIRDLIYEREGHKDIFQSSICIKLSKQKLKMIKEVLALEKLIDNSENLNEDIESNNEIIDEKKMTIVSIIITLSSLMNCYDKYLLNFYKPDDKKIKKLIKILRNSKVDVKEKEKTVVECYNQEILRMEKSTTDKKMEAIKKYREIFRNESV